MPRSLLVVTRLIGISFQTKSLASSTLLESLADHTVLLIPLIRTHISEPI